MKFRTKYDFKSHTKIITPSGSPIFMKQGWIYEEGEYKYVDKEKVPMYEMIQAARDSVDLHAILDRYENEGESALNKVQSMYIDCVELPKNYAQLYDAVSKANDVFDSMPAKIKDKYNNSAAYFWKNYGSDTFDEVINEYRANVYEKYGMIDPEPVKSVEKVEKDVKVDEQKSE